MELFKLLEEAEKLLAEAADSEEQCVSLVDGRTQGDCISIALYWLRAAIERHSVF